MTKQEIISKTNELLRRPLTANGKMELKTLLEKLKQYRKFPSN